jgi:predicted transcriptional regulator
MTDIKAVRRELGLNQTELADKLALHQSTISRFERGDLEVDERTSLAVEALLMRHRAAAPLSQASAG